MPFATTLPLLETIMKSLTTFPCHRIKYPIAITLLALLTCYTTHWVEAQTASDSKVSEPVSRPSPLVGGSLGEYELVWSDEFAGQDVDKTKWHFQTGDHGWGNTEWQNYTDGSNSSVSDGTLKITAKKTGLGQKAGDYTSSRMQSTQSFTYGKIEIRAKMPVHKGNGLWPAIWMLGDCLKTDGWPKCGELDILEYVSYQENTIHCALHCTSHNHVDKTQIEKHIKLETAELKISSFSTPMTSRISN